MKHVRDQNWVAVFLDFLIVVVGVFIGIQVANWNEGRLEREEERLILQRLAVEVNSLLKIQREQLAFNQERAAQLISAHPLLFGQEPIRELSEAECMAITSSHEFQRPTDELPVLDEIRDAGRFDLIRDPELKSSLRNYVLLRERERGDYAMANNDLYRLHSRHPEMIRLTRVAREPDQDGTWTFLSGVGYRWTVHCDLDRMRESQQFLNEYVDNIARRDTLIESYGERIASLAAVAEALGLDPEAVDGNR